MKASEGPLEPQYKAGFQAGVEAAARYLEQLVLPACPGCGLPDDRAETVIGEYRKVWADAIRELPPL